MASAPPSSRGNQHSSQENDKLLAAAIARDSCFRTSKGKYSGGGSCNTKNVEMIALGSFQMSYHRVDRQSFAMNAKKLCQRKRVFEAPIVKREAEEIENERANFIRCT